ncbi:hypothetical protein DEIGR_400121 [Deinococcus grandis]|uniref:Uncharacterized protein n=1 Tax=Deinococcus grandis TaxID=57498 RepID=A0A100HNI6_9DEIO|nr:hypothetical protein [Deinococcus grandis]GAQ23988.1 hypothetical protein DEIGR_400121 [Deinococcus grandis]
MTHNDAPWLSAWLPDGPWLGPFPTRDQAVNAALGAPPVVADHPRVYLARAQYPDLAGLMGDVDAWLAEARAAAGEQFGLPARTYLAEVPAPALDDLQARVDEVMNAWAVEHGLHPTFYRPVDVTEHRITDLQGLTA